MAPEPTVTVGHHPARARRRPSTTGLVTGVLTAALAGLALVGCGGGGDATQAGPAPTGTAVATVAPATTPTRTPRPSPGCTQASSAGATAGASTRTITSGGRERSALQQLPAGMASNDPRPLLLDFHGLGATAQQEAAYSRLATEGAARGYVVLTPGSVSGRSGTMWIAPPLPSNDAAFVTDLLAATEADLCIDLDRVYLAGISNGAMLAGALSCDLADQLAGVAMIAGPNAWKPCPDAPPVTVVAFHGTDDPIIPYDGGAVFAGMERTTGAGTEAGAGTGAEAGETPGGSSRRGAGRIKDRLPARSTSTMGATEIDALTGELMADLAGAGLGGATSSGASEATARGLAVAAAEEATAGWAARDRCATTPTTSTVAADVTRISYTGCADGTMVVLYRIEGGGHTWPGGPTIPGEPFGSTTTDLDATTVLLDTFDATTR